MLEDEGRFSPTEALWLEGPEEVPPLEEVVDFSILLVEALDEEKVCLGFKRLEVEIRILVCPPNLTHVVLLGLSAVVWHCLAIIFFFFGIKLNVI